MKIFSLTWKSLISLGLSGIALAAFTMFSPKTDTAFAGEVCYYGEGTYSLGACRGGQRCHSDGWHDDTTCPS